MAHADPDAPRFRRPWYWLAVIGVAAILATTIVIAGARARISQDRLAFDSAQQLRLQRVEQRIENYFSEAIELATFGARTLGPMRGNLPLTQEVVRAVLRSRHNPAVYGVGAFYVPHAFDARYAFVRVFDRALPGGVDESVKELPAIPAGSDYTRLLWFRDAVARPSRPDFEGPYTQDGRTFISVVQGISDGSRVVGAMTVDTLSDEFKSLLAGPLARGDVVWIELGRRHLVGTAAIPPGTRFDRRLPVRFTHAFVHLSADAAPLLQSQSNEISASAGLVGGIWLVAVLFGFGLVQRWRALEREHELTVQQRRLEAQIALAKTVETELRKAAFTDSLTGLPNRSAFLEHAHAVLAGTERGSVSIFFIDLDRFNIVNETLGHLAGDDLLRTVGGRLQSLVASGDLVARFGGDEFVIMASLEHPPAQAARMLLAHLGEPVLIHGRTIYPQASMGVLTIDDSYSTPEELLRDSDIAMYEAKGRGRGQFAIFDAAMRRRVADASQLEDSLRRAIEHGELEPYYQPIISLVTHRIVGFEALVRWHRADGSLTAAAEFMHFAEQHGFVEAIDTLVFRTVCSQAKTIFDLFPSASIAVNVSTVELASPDLHEMMEPLVTRYELPANRLKLEITETAMMSSNENVRRTIERVRAFGFDLILDDFGTGYSSLSYLQRLPIAGLKIDRSFVEPLLSDPKAVEIVRSIILLAHSFGLTTTAEGVETLEQFQLLARLGVDQAQGFFFSPAVDMAALVLLAQRPVPRAAVE
ncbi:MAG TPA: EAL domain-containing protein [Candidatus Acidoferrales bacterium]|nr:EAL domain-containing protein [Candidatus Acidoferrales bacterium]